MWPVIRASVLHQVKYKSGCGPVCRVLTRVKPCYKIACVLCSFKVPENKFMYEQSSSNNGYNRVIGKCFDKYFYFIHESSLYQNTTINYSILSDMEYKQETPNLLNTLVLPTSNSSKVQQLTDKELQKIMIYLITGKNILEKVKLLHCLDDECAKRTLKWTVNESLFMLDGWIMIDEKFTYSGTFFNILRNLWCKQLQHCSKENLVQILYYLGRSKKPAQSLLLDQIEIMLLHLRKDVTLNEWGIICNGFFKMKTKFKSAKLLHHIADTTRQLKDNDIYILISILKAFRHGNYFDREFLRFLENFIGKAHKNMSVLESAHFLAMFANVNWYSNEVFDLLERQVINNLIPAVEAKNNGSNILSLFDIRIKDIARILWSISHIGHKPKSDKFLETMTVVVKEFLHKDFDKSLRYIIDCVQSLAIMGYYCDDILYRLLRKDTLQKLKLSMRRKPLNQLYFIQSSAEIEALYKSECLPKDNFKTVSSQNSTYKDIRERLGVEQLINVMRRYCADKEEFTCSFILPHIAISSVCIEAKLLGNLALLPDNSLSKPDFQRMKICLEVLDPTVCLQNYQQCMKGLMISKIRQLRKLNYRVVTFTPEAVMEMTDMTTDNLRLHIDEILIETVTESLVSIK